MRVPRAIIKFARREPFLYGPRSEGDWPIQAVPAAGHHLLFLDPQVAKRLHGDGGVYNCAGAMVAALGDLTPLPFEDDDGREIGTLLKLPYPEVGEVLAIFGPLTYLSWYLRKERTGFFLIIDDEGA